jgi:hypothetical protein
MKNRIIDLWQGRLPLSQVFWTFTVLIGTAINTLATGIMFVAIAAGVPAPAAIVFHLLPLPYNTLALVAVWRSAKTYDGASFWATAAQLGAVFWFAAMIVL